MLSNGDVIKYKEKYYVLFQCFFNNKSADELFFGLWKINDYLDGGKPPKYILTENENTPPPWVNINNIQQTRHAVCNSAVSYTFNLTEAAQKFNNALETNNTGLNYASWNENFVKFIIKTWGTNVKV